MDIGSRIRNLRMEQGLSQGQLATRLHVTRQTVSNWENNKNYPDFGTMVEISDLFGVTLDELIKDDSGYIKKQERVERKSVTRRRWIIALVLIMVIITAGLCKYIYDLDQGTEDSNNISSHADIMMSVNLEGQSPSDAISKTYYDRTFESMGEKEQMKVMESVCDETESGIPSVYLSTRSAAEVELLFRHLDYNDIDPFVTGIELYTTNGSHAKPLKRSDKKVDYTTENGRIHFNISDFVEETELAWEAKPGASMGNKLIQNCIFVIRYRFGMNEYVSITAVEVLPEGGDASASHVRNIMIDYYKDWEDVELNAVNVIDITGLDRYQAVAFNDEANYLGIQILKSEDGEYVPDLLNHRFEPDQNFYNVSFMDYDTGKYYVAAFFKNEVKDLSLEFIYENKEWENERYIYYFTEYGETAPAIFMIGETPKYGNMSISIEPVDWNEE